MSKAVEQVNSCTSKTVGQLVWLIDTQNLNWNFKRFDHFDDYNFTIVLKNGPTSYSHCLCSNKFWFCPIYCWPYFLKTKFIISSLLTWSWAGMSLMQMVELLWTDCCQYSQMFSVKKLVFHFINYRPFSNWYVCLQWEYFKLVTFVQQFHYLVLPTGYTKERNQNYLHLPKMFLPRHLARKLPYSKTLF